MENKYLKPMLDNGSPRVFNCNMLTQKIVAANPDAALFFRNKPLNILVLIKDAVPISERQPGAPSVGTKIYFPFNETNIYEGGRTIFLHDKHLQATIVNYFGEGAIEPGALSEDMQLLHLLNRLPSLDPFLMKDAFLRENLAVNEDYFDVSPEMWHEIETYMLQQFEPLVRAAFPNATSTDENARRLIEKMWEARDLDALSPLIQAFRLPQVQALDIFASWKGIVYYAFEYQREQTEFTELYKWVQTNEATVAGVTAAEAKEMKGMLDLVNAQLQKEWQTIRNLLNQYQTSYDRMFKDQQSSTEFLAFLKDSNKTYWTLGNSFGKVNQAIYCWKVMTERFKGQKLPWAQRQYAMRILAKIFEPEKATTTSVAWQ